MSLYKQRHVATEARRWLKFPSNGQAQKQKVRDKRTQLECLTNQQLNAKQTALDQTHTDVTALGLSGSFFFK